MVFIKLRDDLNGKEPVHRFFALNFNAFNQITTFWKIVSFQRLERSIPLCYQKMAQTMRFDVFKVSFHPFNLVNHWERFQCCFAALLFLTVQSVMIVLKKKKKKVRRWCVKEGCRLHTYKWECTPIRPVFLCVRGGRSSMFQHCIWGGVYKT